MIQRKAKRGYGMILTLVLDQVDDGVYDLVSGNWRSRECSVGGEVVL
jgi:hypothetical protein